LHVRLRKFKILLDGKANLLSHCPLFADDLLLQICSVAAALTVGT